MPWHIRVANRAVSGRVVPRAGPDRPQPEVPKLEGRQIKKIVNIKLLFIRILELIWRPRGIKKEEMSLKKLSCAEK